MYRIPADLRAILNAVRIHDPRNYSVLRQKFELSSATPDLTELGKSIAHTIYQLLYCRPARERLPFSVNTRAARVFVDELSGANCGTGTWEPGWVIHAIEEDGTLVVHKEHDDLTLWAQPEQFRPTHRTVSVGVTGRLRLGKELREMLPGYYTVLGDADQLSLDDGSAPDVVRFYWHLTWEISPVWIRELTRRFNSAGVPFHAKVQSDPNAYFRADAGVLYVASADATRVLDLIPGLHLAVSKNLRQTTPMFTKRLARGLAVADDPGDGRSFGQHRCQLVAEALVRAFERGITSQPQWAEAVAARFAEEGLDITTPWLNAGSKTCCVWPGPPTQTATSRAT